MRNTNVFLSPLGVRLLYWLSVISSPYAIAALFAFVYVLTLTSDYFWDGITFALQIEKVARGERGNELLFHQNHLLYNAFGYFSYCLARRVASSIQALTVLQVANVFVAAAGVGVFCRIAERVTRSRYAALVCSSALAFSATWWKLATDADAYVLSVLLILICLENLLSQRPRWYVAGLALAGAMLIHELASLFSIAAVVAVFSSRKIQRKRRFAAAMWALAWSLTITTYYLCAGLLHNFRHPLDVVRWATSNPSLIAPSSNPIPGMGLTLRASLDLIVGHSFSMFRQQGRIGWVLAAALIILASVFIVRLMRISPTQFIESLHIAAPEIADSWKQSIPVLIAWVSLYLAFLCFFESQDPYLRLFYAPALALGFGLMLSNYRLLTAKQQGVRSGSLRFPRTAVLAVATLALFNFAFFINPHMRRESNAIVAAARNANRVWDDSTVILYANHNEADTTFEYFNKETHWQRLSSASIDTLDSTIETAYKEGRSVWLNKQAVGRIDANWLAQYAQGKQIRVDADYAQALYIEILPKR